MHLLSMGDIPMMRRRVLLRLVSIRLVAGVADANDRFILVLLFDNLRHVIVG